MPATYAIFALPSKAAWTDISGDKYIIFLANELLNKFVLSFRIVHMKEKMKCTFCNHEDSQKWRMMEHIRVNHFGEVLYPCHLCNFHTDGKRKLENHVKNAHAVTITAAAAAADRIKTKVIVQNNSQTPLQQSEHRQQQQNVLVERQRLVQQQQQQQHEGGQVVSPASQTLSN